ncbi:unnamed protein product [Camellia sinensis]
MSGAAEVFYASETGKWVLAILMPSDYIPGHKITVLEQAFNRNLLGSFLRIGNGGK